MVKGHLTRTQKEKIALAKEWYAVMQSGGGTPLNQVPYIRELLEEARVEITVLDETGTRTATEIESELKVAYARGEQMRLDAWRKLEGPS